MMKMSLSSRLLHRSFCLYFPSPSSRKLHLDARPSAPCRSTMHSKYERRLHGSEAEGTAPLSTVEQLLHSGARVTTAAHYLWNDILRPGDTAVDATCGNGHDFLLMAQRVGPSGTCIGFDVQQRAVEATRERIDASLSAEARPRIELHAVCHSRLQEYVGSGRARLVAFNLGYLPLGDKSVRTHSETTLDALEASLEVLAPGGLLSVMCYTGHEGGQEEYEGVKRLAESLSTNYWITLESRLMNRKSSPIWVQIWRRPG